MNFDNYVPKTTTKNNMVFGITSNGSNGHFPVMEVDDVADEIYLGPIARYIDQSLTNSLPAGF
jgi:hypothetical protein